VVAEPLDVRVVEGAELAHVLEEAHGLDDVGELGTDRGQLGRDVGDGLARLGLHTAFDQRALDHAELTGDDDPLTGFHDRAVRTDGLGHGASCSAGDVTQSESTGTPKWRRVTTSSMVSDT
jgi:hypothetical protein